VPTPDDKTKLKPRKEEPLISLKNGTRLAEYEIVKTLGIGGFGITYLARDSHLDKDVAIKEYFPTQLAYRDSTLSVHPRQSVNEEQDIYQWGLERVIQEARVMAQFDHPNVIRVYRYFEANGTAYIVMDYAAGPSLKQRIKQSKSMDEAEFAPMLFKLIDGLAVVHRADILHRDIKPTNIIVREDGNPVLIDFGAAKQTIGNQATVATAFQSLGYTPLEQLGSAGKLGPYTDIYALAATAYCALTGKPPADCNDRVISNDYVPASEAAKDKASAAFLAAIDWGLELRCEARPQNLDEWLAAFQQIDQTRLRTSPTETKPAAKARLEETPTVANNDVAMGKWLGAAALLVLVIALLLWMFVPFSSDVSDLQEQDEPTLEPTMAKTTSTPEPTWESTPTPIPTPAPMINPQDAEDFEKAQYIDTPEAYSLYLRLHPQGHYVDEARQARSPTE